MSQRGPAPQPPAATIILEALPNPVLCIGQNDTIIETNPAAERFFGLSRSRLVGRRVDDLVAKGSPLIALIEQVRQRSASITEHAVEIAFPRPLADQQSGEGLLDIYAAPMTGQGQAILLSFQERSRADKITRQLSHRGAARSISAMAAILAHEIKNPLSGIRGAAQLLEGEPGSDAQPLTQLIRDEVDRIVRLVERFEVFSETAPTTFSPVNIHEVLDHVRRLAKSGFARNVRFLEEFDPSLPPVYGHWDQLVQVLLNLIKNAAEATGDVADAEIVLSTAYRPGIHVVVPSTGQRTSLPLEVCVIDNGPGVPEHLLEHLFEPFITTKSYGTGLGLAAVAKIVSDHGGVIECERVKRGTRFRILLPVHRYVEPGRS
jgi:two-component system nitrogen regulation sensor histidine kinase GlnL